MMSQEVLLLVARRERLVCLVKERNEAGAAARRSLERKYVGAPRQSDQAPRTAM
jgi:hypothetical protein